MATKRQMAASRKNIKKAQSTWKSMTSRQHSLSQPEGRSRAKPGTKGGGQYFRIVVRPKEQFTSFRYHDIGKPGHVQRLAGRRSSGSWDTQAWLISKEDAHRSDGSLVADSSDAKKILGTLGSSPHIVKGDVFEAKDRPNIPEREKPTKAQRTAQQHNIRRAQAARWQ